VTTLRLLCLDGISTAFAQTSDKANYNNCVYGSYPCEKSRLTQSEQERVAAAEYKRNYNNCLYGLYPCEKSRLTQSEQDQVSAAEYKRNYNNCLYGLYPCEKPRLTPGEQDQVSAAEYKRNFNNCLYGLYPCEKSRLTPSERDQVTAAAHKRNYNNCLYGLYPCDRSMLNGSTTSNNTSSPLTTSRSATPSADEEQLRYFEGKWSLKGEIYTSKFGLGGKFTGTHRNDWMQDTSLVSRWDEQRPAGKDTGQAIYRYDSDKKTYSYHGVGTTGETEDAIGILNDKIWVWSNDLKSEDGATFRGRFTVSETSPTSYTFKFEIAPAASEWTTIMEGTASKTK